MTALRRAVFGAFVLGLGLSITLSETALTLLTLLWLWRLRDPEARAAARWPLWQPVVAFSAVSLVSALASGHPVTALGACKGLLLVAALYVTVDVLAGPQDGHRFLSALLVVATVAAAVGVLQTVVCPGPAADYGSPAWLYHRCNRARGFFSIYMTLAGVLSLVLLANLPRLLPGARLPRWPTLPWLVSLVGLLATYTRGAWMGFVVGVLALIPATRKGRWLLLGGLIVLGLTTLAGPQHLRQRFLTMGDPDDPTVKERVYMWRSGLTMWRQHPVLGVGPGGVKREYASYALPEAVKKRTGHVHNTPLQILVERGVLGLAAWVWIWAAFYWKALSVLRRLPENAGPERALVIGSLAAIVAFLVGGFSEYNFGDSEVVMVAWALMALPWAVTAKERAPHPDPLPKGERGSG
ncbi:MAG TPA: O-antigen ligase family protein [Candidatus Acidoferrum sp.]|nr:O-antigen ligase family protein [Candidatus Acidoferrum sp.]